MSEAPETRDRFGFDWTGVSGMAFWRRPHWNRRMFFQHLASAVGGYFVLPSIVAPARVKAAVTPIATAKNVVFVLMAGGPSHIDTFDLKMTPQTPSAFNPTQYGDILWPQAIMPKIAEHMDSIALLRSVRAWASVHSLGQTWVQIGRNPTSSLSRIAPHIGSVASMELSNKSATLPAFVSLNTVNGPGAGYFPSDHAPFYVSPNGGGLGNTIHRDGQAAFERRYALLQRMAAEESVAADIGANSPDIAAYTAAARRLSYNPDVDRIFNFDAAERNRYGTTQFGNACITARNLLRANLGTRFIQITIGGWDNHAGIYTGAFNPANANSLIRQFDNGLGTLLSDLKADGRLDDTLVIAMGEFGRTVRGTNGSLNNQAGRDHFLTQAVMMAGAKISGRKALGKTDADGYDIVETGWNRNKLMRVEDIEATIYSALGIDWTTIRRDDPFGRGFEYVPFADRGEYAPIHELWA